jgi:hypothetical protein
MTTERAQAYGRVMRTLEELAGTKLHPGEVQLLREAADELVFCRSFEADATAQQTLAGVYELIDDLTSSERLLGETARALVADVEACGPFESDAKAAA